MISRRKTRVVEVGPVRLGGGNPVAIQSMTKVDTSDVGACVRQVRRLTAAGCDLVRLAVPTRADTAAFGEIVRRVDVPLIADVHFSPERAIEAIEAGAAKIRINPGNIKKQGDVLRIIDCAKLHGAAMRIGVNEASIRDLKADVPAARRTGLMVREMTKYVRIFERRGFEKLVLSVKSADVVRTIEANRAVAEAFDYPIHVGLTHAGLPEDARIPSAVAIGTLLAEGIGDTIRVSVAGDPVAEVQLGREILRALGLYEEGRPRLTVCPTCGRCKIDVVRLARQVRKLLDGVEKPLKVAVMGCIVNGPGECADADLAVCAAEGKGFIYAHGKKKAVVPEEKLLDTLADQIRSLQTE
ncbi:MAG: flavodoxin-dependent (E)-4-hydroxy-3-methylbut-2-enyl-diphosphate synthase [Phycisphaerae bacterium]|nr:flavodoxin-dependent (E)-4-hydroxy-3-methylbut-2-enyl-diphosphate synthase [Phycisphaerae bacterium]